MGKKLVLMLLLLSSLSMVGCIVINNKEDEKASAPDNTTKEVIIKENNSNSNNSSNGNVSSNRTEVSKTNGYIFSDSNRRYLSSSDLHGLTKWELKIARNEIFARHGRLFKDKSLQKYFDSCNWYYGSISADSFNESVLNDMEAKNVKLIGQYE